MRLTIEQERGFVTATYSALRGALLGSAQALWAMMPEESAARQERGLILAQEWYFRRIEWQSERTPDLGLEEAARSGEQLKRLDADFQTVKALRHTDERLNATRIVRLAALDAFETEALARSCVGEWRRVGGDPHALGWPLMGQQTTWGTRGEDGLSEALVTVDLVSVANAYPCAWTLYARATARLEETSTR